MPVVLANKNFPYQVGASSANQAYSVQLNFRQMIGEVTQWNPNVDSNLAGRMINNRYRQIVDRRKWYGLKVMGMASCPNIDQTGQATVTNGSATVQGTGTNWTTALIGLQFRTSFIYGLQTIIAVNVANQTLTLDTPFQGTTATGGYYIAEAYLTFGGNIENLAWANNQLFGWPIEVNVPVETINARDTWRQRLGWATTFATRPPTTDGQFQVEVWPTPYQAQEFTWEGWTNPADMVLDGDCPVAWIRSDILVTGAISDALLFRPKQNAYYSEQTAVTIAGEKRGQFEKDLLEADNKDERLQQQAVTWDYGEEDGVDASGNGSLWSQMHE